MTVVRLVTDAEAALARKMEKRLLLLPEQVGILFAAVTVTPAEEEQPASYNVWVGGKREFDEATLCQIAYAALAQEVQAGAVVRVEAKRGVTRETAGLPPPLPRS